MLAFIEEAFRRPASAAKEGEEAPKGAEGDGMAK